MHLLYLQWIVSISITIARPWCLHRYCGFRDVLSINSTVMEAPQDAETYKHTYDKDNGGWPQRVNLIIHICSFKHLSSTCMEMYNLIEPRVWQELRTRKIIRCYSITLIWASEKHKEKNRSSRLWKRNPQTNTITRHTVDWLVDISTSNICSYFSILWLQNLW